MSDDTKEWANADLRHEEREVDALRKEIAKLKAEIERLRRVNTRIVATQNDYNAGFNDGIRIAEKQFAERDAKQTPPSSPESQ